MKRSNKQSFRKQHKQPIDIDSMRKCFTCGELMRDHDNADPATLNGEFMGPTRKTAGWHDGWYDGVHTPPPKNTVIRFQRFCGIQHVANSDRFYIPDHPTVYWWKIVEPVTKGAA